MTVMAEPFSRLVPGGRDRATQGIQAARRRGKYSMSNTPSVPVISSEGNLSRYLQGNPRSFRCWSRNRNSCSPSPGVSMATPEAAHKLVTSHLRLVAKIAMGYRVTACRCRN